MPKLCIQKTRCRELGILLLDRAGVQCFQELRSLLTSHASESGRMGSIPVFGSCPFGNTGIAKRVYGVVFEGAPFRAPCAADTPTQRQFPARCQKTGKVQANPPLDAGLGFC